MSATGLKLGILAAGITPDELLGDYSSYAGMFEELFRRIGEQFNCVVFDVRENHFPNDVNECDAWLITGSKFSVYDGFPWIAQLLELVRDIDVSGRPLLGICFGHQIIAEALGGSVEKNRGGWGVGLHHYEVVRTHKFMREAMSGFALSAMHQDQVVEKPRSATVLASSEFCPFAALGYGDSVLTFQAHPEFTSAFEKDLVALRKGSVIPAEVGNSALASLTRGSAEPDSESVARWMAAFLKQIDQ